MGGEGERGWGREMPEGRDRHRARDLVAARVVPRPNTHCWMLENADRLAFIVPRGHRRQSVGCLPYRFMSAEEYTFGLRLFSGNEINAELKVDDVDLCRDYTRACNPQ